jgi:hypothetical protein
LPAPKSRSAHILPHKRWHAGEMTKGNADLREILSSHLGRSCHALMGSYPIIAAILRWVIAAPGCWIKTGTTPHPHPTPWKGGKSNDSPHTYTHTFSSSFLPFSYNWTL